MQPEPNQRFTVQSRKSLSLAKRLQTKIECFGENGRPKACHRWFEELWDLKRLRRYIGFHMHLSSENWDFHTNLRWSGPEFLSATIMAFAKAGSEGRSSEIKGFNAQRKNPCQATICATYLKQTKTFSLSHPHFSCNASPLYLSYSRIHYPWGLPAAFILRHFLVLWATKLI